MKRIYLAGFDVFSPDAIEIGQIMKNMCAEFGFEGVYPLDKECHTPDEIFMSNTALIRSCDIIAANMNRFRGFEPDSGTAFELGFGYFKAFFRIGIVNFQYRLFSRFQP